MSGRPAPDNWGGLGEIFRAEASEHLASFRAGIWALAAGDAPGAWGEMRQAAHTLRGAAGAAKRPDVSAVAGELEALATEEPAGAQAMKQASRLVNDLHVLLDAEVDLGRAGLDSTGPTGNADQNWDDGAGTRVRVIIADDSPTFRAALLALIETDPGMAAVAAACDAEEAAALVAEHLPDVVLLDVHMPAAGGEWVLEQVGKSSPGSRVIVVSGEDNPLTQQAMLDAGAVAFFVKGTNGTSLLQAIREHAPALPANQGTERGVS